MPLDVFDGVELPEDFVTQSAGIVARRGAGKTYTALKLTEELVRASLPVAVLDPLGVCYGLRTSADGKSAGLPVTILGGDFGDLPLEPTDGAVVARFIVEHPGAYVLDLSGPGFDSLRSQDRFAEDFMVALYRAKNSDRTPLHLVMDEADSFAPQRPGEDQKRMLGAAEAIVRRGRSRGLGVTLITQRPAVINKNVLSQVELLVALQVTAPQDRKALEEWAKGFSEKPDRDRFLDGLARLKVGEAWLWSPAWLGIFQQVMVKRRVTFDSSSTPKAGETRTIPRVLAPVDLDALKAEMEASIEKAKAEDPKVLAATIREQAKRIRELEAVSPTPDVVEAVVEVPVVPPELVAALDSYRGLHERLIQTTGALVDEMAPVTAAVEKALLECEVGSPATKAKLPAARPIARTGTPAPAPAPRPARPAARSTRDSPVENPESTPTFGPDSAPARILAALAKFPDGRTRRQLAALTGLAARKSTIRNALSTLRVAGLIEEQGDLIRLTDAGVDAAGGVDPLPTGPALLDHWRSEVGGADSAPRRIFDLLVDRWPETLSRADITDQTGYDGSTLRNALSKLRSYDLITGDVRASDELMEAVG